MTIGIVSHPACKLHDMGFGHPESAQRLSAIDDHMVATGLEFAVRHYEAPAATREQLLRVHTEAHVSAMSAAVPLGEALVEIDPDTRMNAHTLEAARRAAGAVIKGVDLVWQGEEQAVFCNVRPPGHHATRNAAMGFCFFNNIAVGAAHAMAAHGCERVAIVDFDVHHGNGTQDIFEHDNRVLFCSTFQHPFYPHSGAGSAPRNMVNVPLPAGTAGAAFRAAVTKRWLPAMEDFAPQIVLVSAGFDGHLEDEMAHFMLTEDDYAWVTGAIKAVADRHAGGRLVSALEGGYALSALGRSVGAHLRALLG